MKLVDWIWSLARFVGRRGAVVLAALGLMLFGVGGHAWAQAVPSTAVPRGGAARVASAPGNGQAGASATPVEGVVNINVASEDELQRLPGVGPARAAAIIALRQRLQRFRSPEDLLRVRGIGRVGFRRMRGYLSLTGDTTLDARPGRAVRQAD